jgi:hypothetical protein
MYLRTGPNKRQLCCVFEFRQQKYDIPYWRKRILFNEFKAIVHKSLNNLVAVTLVCPDGVRNDSAINEKAIYKKGGPYEETNQENLNETSADLFADTLGSVSQDAISIQIYFSLNLDLF